MKFGASLFLAVLLAPSLPAWSRTLTLSEAVGFALQHSPAFDTAKKTQAVRDLEYKSAIAKLLPSLDFTTTNGLQNNIPIASTATLFTPNPSDPWFSSLNVGLTENLYDNGVSITQAKIAGLSRDLANVGYLKARDELALNVATEFYRYSLATVLYEVRKQQETILEKQFNTLESQYQQGFKTKNDFLRLKSQLQRAEIERVNAQNNIELSAAELRKLLGVGIEELEPPTFASVEVRRDQESRAWLPTQTPAIERAFEYRLAKVQKEINERSVSLAERNYWPRVSAAAGLSYINQNYLNSNEPFAAGHQLSWNALLKLEFNVWDWGIRRRDVEIAKNTRDIQDNALELNLLSTKAGVTRLMADLSRISRNFNLSKELLSLEEESNRNLEMQYREGKVAYLDMITGLNSLLDAKVQFYTSYFDALQGIARYRYFEGKAYEELVKK